jgi:4-methyl-5(b-hydroxyethyl)-thiazole monophosphate biosynthesis
MIKKALIPIADGTEEIEAVCIIDVLRRAETDVTVASVGEQEITASRGVKIVADKLIEECTEEKYDLIALPGGMPGAEHLRDCQTLTKMLKDHAAAGRLYAAICASPVVVLQQENLLKGKKATCHPAFADKLEDNSSAELPVVKDGNCITGKGPAVAIDFALELVSALYGEKKAKEVALPMATS